MDVEILDRLAYIKNRCQICLYERFKDIKTAQSFDWENISRILYFYDDLPICSICFNKRPLLPRMDKCGHIFCLSCIIIFFNHKNSKYIRCPVCMNIDISLNSIKRVILIKNKRLNDGEMVSLNLLVKINNKISPRSAQKTFTRNNNIPYSGSILSKYSSISIDKNRAVKISIRKDIKLIEKLREKRLESLDKYNIIEILSYLTTELKKFESDLEISYVLKDSIKIYLPEDSFNLLNYKRGSESTVFYQSCDCRFFYLDEDIQNEIIDKAFRAGKLPPVSIQGQITSQIEYIVDKKFISNTKMNHLFVGANLRFVKIDLKNAIFTEINSQNLQKLKSHQKMLADAKNQVEEMKTKIINGINGRKHNRGRHNKTLISDPNLNHFKNVRRNLNIVSGFNTCTLGLECVVPDDDYPHSESCCFFNKLQLNSPSQQSETDDSKEKYFGLLQMKMNVFHPAKVHSIAEKPINKRKSSPNYPPECIEI